MIAGSLKTPRRHDLDFVRVVAFTLLIPYHASLIFGTLVYPIHADQAFRAFDLFDIATHPWRMTVLFFLSGVSTAFLAQKIPPARLFMERSRRLLVPLTVGLLLFVAPIAYIYNRVHGTPNAGFIQSWLVFLYLLPADGSTSTYVRGTLHHLWFLLYLWIYIVLWLGLAACFPGPVEALRTWSVRMMTSRFILFVPIIFYAIARAALFPMFHETLVVYSDGYLHVIHFATFVLGYLIALDQRVWTKFADTRRMALLLSLLGLAVCVLQFYLLDDVTPGDVHPIPRAILKWSAVIAFLGYAHAYIHAPNPVIRYLNKGVLTYYVVHEVILILIAYWLHRQGLLGPLAYLPIIAATFAACALLYEGQRRLMIPAFGLASRGSPR